MDLVVNEKIVITPNRRFLVNYRFKFGTLHHKDSAKADRSMHKTLTNLDSAHGLAAVYKRTCLLLLFVLFLSGCALHPSVDNGPELKILHTNDMHSHFAGSKSDNACLREEGCTGGYSAIAAYVKQAKKEDPETLFLDAGDQFQGSLLYVNGKSQFVRKIDNLMGFNCATLGNHEFDEGCEKLLAFINTANYQFLAANLKPEDGCALRKANIKPYVITEYNKERVGIIGIANPDVVSESIACRHTKFINPIQAVRSSVQEIQKAGVHVIIVLSHMGLPFDKKLASEVADIDIIVGGHTHDYIGPGSKIGGYPIVEKSPNGAPVLIVTTSGEAKYLGNLSVRFDNTGKPISWSGSPMLMGKAGGDKEITQIIDEAAEKIQKENSVIVGENRVRANDGMEACRHGDCFSAFLVTRAMLEYAKKNGASIALINGGSFRGSISVGTVTKGDLDNLQPFQDILEIKEYTGRELLEAVESGVSDEGGIGPRILQTAGLRYSYDPTAEVGKRVISVEVQNQKGRWVPIKLNRRYTVALNTFLASGGDGHKALGSGKVVKKTNVLIPELFAKWLTKNSPVLDRPEQSITAITGAKAER